MAGSDDEAPSPGMNRVRELESTLGRLKREARAAEDALTLSRDDRRAIQRALSLLGHDPKGIDGVFGSGSRLAIAAWQKKNGYESNTYLTRDQIVKLTEQADAAQERISALLAQYTAAMGHFGSAPGQIDTLVLGCTHYVFVEKPLQTLLGPDVQLVSTGEAVARHTKHLLENARLLRTGPAPLSPAHRMSLLTTGDLHGLQAAGQRWLGLPHAACHKANPPV